MIQSGVRERSAGANGSYPAGCRSNYEVARGQVAAALRAILPLRAIRVVDAELLGRAVEVYEVNRLDFVDAYLWPAPTAPASAMAHRPATRRRRSAS